MSTDVPRTRTARGARLAVGAALLSVAAHGAILCATPWFVVRLPEAVEAQRLRDLGESPDEPVFFLDLRTTAILAPEVPPALDPGGPTVPDVVPEEVADEPVAEPESTPESVLASTALADPEAPPQELTPPQPADAAPEAIEPVVVAAVVGNEAETGPIETAPPAAMPGVGRRSSTPSASAWVARAATFAAGALAGPITMPPAGKAAPRAGTPDPGEGPGAFAPRLLDAPKPDYPEACRRRRIEGTVLCRMHVRADGRVERVDVVESSQDERLDRSAVRALERWRFEAPRRAGVAIESKVLHRVSFRLR